MTMNKPITLRVFPFRNKEFLKAFLSQNGLVILFLDYSQNQHIIAYKTRGRKWRSARYDSPSYSKVKYSWLKDRIEAGEDVSLRF